METVKNFSGKGLDVSKKFYLNKQKNVIHKYLEPNNLYRINSKKYESFDFIYSKNLINSTKFYKILLKEWSYFCKKGGHIIIEFRENKILNLDKILEEIDLLLKRKFEIIKKEGLNKNVLIILRKLKSSLVKGDSIKKWSFGIITDGTKEDALKKQIDSIIALKIPFYEIIVCGDINSPEIKKKVTKYIPFKPRLAWITKKKNLIAKNAKYENLVITHNRFIFDKDWYKGMKEYGNYFEVLTCKIISSSGQRAGDWLTYGLPIENRYYNWTGLLDYKDWDENLIINGSFYILKKSTWKKCPWDERLIWGQYEDDMISKDFHKKGIVPRFNEHSTVHTFPERYGNWKWKYKYNSKKLGKIPPKLNLNYLKKLFNYLSRKYLGVGFVVKANYKTYGW